MRKETKSSLMKATITHAPPLCGPSTVTLETLTIPSVPHVAQEEAVISHDSHCQVLPSTWAPAAGLSSVLSSLTIPGCICHQYKHRPEVPACLHPPVSTSCGLSQERVRHRRWKKTSLSTCREKAESGLDQLVAPHPSDLPFASHMPQKQSLPAPRGGSLEGECF